MARKPTPKLSTRTAAIRVLEQYGGGPLPIKQLIEETLPLISTKGVPAAVQDVLQTTRNPCKSA